jgi:hypothetical protein
MTRLSHFLSSELQASAKSRHCPAEPAMPSHAWGKRKTKVVFELQIILLTFSGLDAGTDEVLV